MDADTPRDAWDGRFGEEYTVRNPQTATEVDELTRERYGTSRRDLNERFLEAVPRDARVLEVGCNVGAQLSLLAEMRFEHLYGIDVQRYAVEKAHQLHPGLNVIEGEATDLPFKDGFFDLVYTSGVLIHVPPDDIDDALREIGRCSSRWIYGLEYYADEYTEVEYRGQAGMLWKTDFAKRYRETLDVSVVDSALLEYRDDDLVDQMFLLEKA